MSPLLLLLLAAAPFEPVWTASSAETREALEAIRGAERQGLVPDDYAAPRFEALLAGRGVDGAELTRALVRFAEDLGLGRIDPETSKPRRPDGRALRKALFAALERHELAAFLRTLPPTAPAYWRLVDALAAYRSVPTSRGARLTAARIALNLERWRSLPRDLGDPYLWINVPAFSATLHDHGAVVLESRVIAGKPERKTPVLHGDAQRVVLNPIWHVPDRNARLDLLPLIQKDAGYLARMGFEVFDEGRRVDPAAVPWSTLTSTTFHLSLVQAPGKDNALGRIRIEFENPEQVYLHDTPHRELFEAKVRALSSGCIRVERALELGRWLVESDADALAAFEDALRTGKTRWIDAVRRPRVHLVYLTVSVREDGAVEIHRDLYGRDHLRLPQETGTS